MKDTLASVLLKTGAYKVQLFNEILPDLFGRSEDISDDVSQADTIIGLLKNGLILLFVAVIILAVVYSALAGIKFITSQGNSDKVTEASDALKNVLVGVAAAFLGVIAIFIITAIFSDTSRISVRDSLECFLGNTASCK